MASVSCAHFFQIDRIAATRRHTSDRHCSVVLHAGFLVIDAQPIPVRAQSITRTSYRDRTIRRPALSAEPRLDRTQPTSQAAAGLRVFRLFRAGNGSATVPGEHELPWRPP
jgi:hypothetical protein